MAKLERHSTILLWTWQLFSGALRMPQPGSSSEAQLAQSACPATIRLGSAGLSGHLDTLLIRW